MTYPQAKRRPQKPFFGIPITWIFRSKFLSLSLIIEEVWELVRSDLDIPTCDTFKKPSYDL